MVKTLNVFLTTGRKKRLKKLFGFGPIFFVDAIFDGGRGKIPLNQTGLFQHFKVLRNSGIGHGQLFGNIAGKTGALLFEELKNKYAGRVGQGFGVARYFFVAFGVWCCGGRHVVGMGGAQRRCWGPPWMHKSTPTAVMIGVYAGFLTKKALVQSMPDW
jgi:hypothetical protein